MRVRPLFAVVLLGSLAVAASVRAEPLLTGLGGPADYGPGNLAPNDDGYSPELDITAAFPSGLRFFGMTFTSLYVNNNGNVSFGGGQYTFTPQAFPVSDLRMIAAWWGDVDTRGTSRGGPPARNGVYWSITPGRFVATWHNVGYYGSHDDHWNDFQLILTAAGPGAGDFDVEFRYNRCDWTTGDASGGSGGFGGTPAQAGFDAGNLRDYIALPGSLTMRVLELCTTSNVSIPGVWRFAIRNGEVGCPGYGNPCLTGLPGACAAGTNRCRSATETICVQDAMPSEDVCNGLDDDCDGSVDEALPILSCGVGACAVTQPSCVGGVTQACIPGAPVPETCNRIDDDCNDAVDDMADLTCGLGACFSVVPACVDGVAGVCTPGVAHPETCNGIDDDCNGRVDDGLMMCISPDANLHDAGPPDAGRVDAGPDASVYPDGGRCRGWDCDPWNINGRAGPGCDCAVSGARGSTRGALALTLGALALALARRRRHR